MGLFLFVLKVNSQLGACQPVHFRKEGTSIFSVRKKPQRKLQKEAFQHFEYFRTRHAQEWSSTTVFKLAKTL